jgi:hypothetical protein
LAQYRKPVRQYHDKASAQIPGRIGLVPAQRPADVLAGLGWQGAVNSRLTADITAVLRSWEDRFGTRLLEVGAAGIRLLISRPPRTLEAALPIAAEHFAFSEEAHGGLRDVDAIARAIAGNPVLGFLVGLIAKCGGRNVLPRLVAPC